MISNCSSLSENYHFSSASDTWGTQQSCVSEDAVPWPCRHMSVTFAAMATHIWTLGCKTVAPSPGLFYGARSDSQSPLKPVYLSGSFRGCYPPIHVGLVLSQSSLIFPFLSSSHIWGLEYLFLLENSHWLGWQLSHSLKTLFSYKGSLGSILTVQLIKIWFPWIGWIPFTFMWNVINKRVNNFYVPHRVQCLTCSPYWN